MGPLALSLLLAAPCRQEAPAPPQPSVEDEVLANIRNQPLGAGTVADLGLPEEFLRRFADRVIRSSFEDHLRVVVDDSELDPVPPPGAASAPPGMTPGTTPASGPSAGWFTPLRLAALGTAVAALVLFALLRGRKA